MVADSDRAREGAARRRARLVAVVLIATALAWLGLQWLGATLGWPGGLVLVIDLAALTAFAWSLTATYGIWRRRRGTGD